MPEKAGLLERAPDRTGRPLSRRPVAVRIVTAAAVTLCVLALPVVIVLGGVRFAFSWQPVYSYAITTYRPEETTGVPAPELVIATHLIRNYFTNRQRDLDVTVTDAAGDRVPLFNEREIAHMRDVKALVQRFYKFFDISLAVLLLCALAGLSRGRSGIRTLARSILAGSALTGALLLSLGVVAVAGFDQLFLAFHLLSFSNSNWELDPTRDHLIQLFPQGYWLDVTLFVVVLALVTALLTAALSATYLLLTRPPRREQRSA
ncbi:MAG TPA: TIGR01906 family membrane protein [Dehalococcoidia bacterium]|nr:TIGR01906 family membrane protein [Dehalococcoidia bacterium]